MSFWEFWQISMEIFRAGEILVISHFVENALILIDIHFGKIFHFGTLGQKWDSETLIMTWPYGGLISILNVLSSKIIRPALWDFEREVYLLVARNYSISKRELTICKCNTVVTWLIPQEICLTVQLIAFDLKSGTIRSFFSTHNKCTAWKSIIGSRILKFTFFAIQPSFSFTEIFYSPTGQWREVTLSRLFLG